MSVLTRKAELEKAYREALDQVEREEAQLRLASMPRTIMDALVNLEQARSQERRAPLPGEHIYDALYEAIKAIAAVVVTIQNPTNPVEESK